MPEETLQQVETEATVKGHTVISFKHPTPMWATWVFRTEFILNKALTLYLAGTEKIPQEDIKEYMLIMGAVDLVVWFFARSLIFPHCNVCKLIVSSQGFTVWSLIFLSEVTSTRLFTK